MLAEFCCAPFSCVSEFFTVFLYIYRICTVPREEGLGLKVCSLILAFWSPVLVLTPSATIDEPLQDKLAKRSQIPRCFATRTLLADRFRRLASSGPFKLHSIISKNVTPFIVSWLISY